MYESTQSPSKDFTVQYEAIEFVDSQVGSMADSSAAVYANFKTDSVNWAACDDEKTVYADIVPRDLDAIQSQSGTVENDETDVPRDRSTIVYASLDLVA